MPQLVDLIRKAGRKTRATPDGVLFTNICSLLTQAADAARKLRPGAMSVVPVESLTSVQAAFAMDSVAEARK